MRAFSAAYLGELTKLIGRRKYIVFIMIGIIICAAWAIIGSAVSGAALRFSGMMVNLTPTPMGVFPPFAQTMVPLLIFMGVCDLITAESAVMKALICRPVERWKLYAGKVLAVITYAGIYLSVIFVTSTVLSQVLGRPSGIDAIVHALLAYALALLPLAVLALFAGLVALFGRSASLTMLVLIALYILMRALPVAFPILSELLFTSYIGWHRLWLGARPAASRLIHVLLIVLGYGAVFFTAGSLVFDRKEY